MTDTPHTFPRPTHRPDLVDFLSKRRSNLAKVMGGPGPNADTRDKILEIAARVPDHRKLAPWRFVLFEGEARSSFGQHISTVFMAQNPAAPADRAIFEGARLTPKWEQELSAGAVCFNMCLAAQAHGFGAQWLTEWYAYDAAVNTALGVRETERVAGYVYIGTPQAEASPRSRPDVKDLITKWRFS